MDGVRKEKKKKKEFGRSQEYSSLNFVKLENLL